MKNKIAIFHNLPDGGAKNMINEISTDLKKSVKVNFFTVTDRLTDKQSGLVCKVKPWPGFLPRNLWILSRLPNYHKKMASQINSGGFNSVLVSHDYMTKSPYILKYISAKTVYLLQEPQREFYESWSVHSPRVKDKIANVFRYYIKILDKKNCQSSDKVFTNSKYSKKVVKKVYGVNAGVIYPKVNTNFFRPSRKKKSNFIICVGGLDKFKGHYFVAGALKPILGKYKLVIVGDGTNSDKSRILKAAGNKRSSIKILGKVPKRQLKKLYQDSILHCVGAHHEPLGLTSLEAQACGKQVVTVNEGGVPETIKKGITGYVCERNNLQFLINVKKAIRNSSRKKTISECRKHVLSWNKNKAVPSYASLYRELLS